MDSEKLLRINCAKVRREVLNQINYVKTCVLARELCLIIRTHKAVLEKQDVHDCCGFISNLCNGAGCKEASEFCAKAAEVVIESEEKYIALCEQSCRKCIETKMPKKQSLERTGYVA
jgi:hypothetical protein